MKKSAVTLFAFKRQRNMFARLASFLALSPSLVQFNCNHKMNGQIFWCTKLKRCMEDWKHSFVSLRIFLCVWSCGKKAVVERGCRKEVHCYRKFVIWRFRSSKRAGRTGEVARKEYQVWQALRVKIILSIEIVEKRLLETALHGTSFKVYNVR